MLPTSEARTLDNPEQKSTPQPSTAVSKVATSYLAEHDPSEAFSGGLGVLGLGFRVWCFGFRVRVWGGGSLLPEAGPGFQVSGRRDDDDHPQTYQPE